MNLIAPVTIKKGAYIAAGSTITEDVEEYSLVIARSRQTNKENWVMNLVKHRRRKRKRMNWEMNNIKIMAGSLMPVAQSVAKILGVPLSDTDTERFSDGETYVIINESIRGCDIFVIQSVSEPVNDNLMNSVIDIDALKRASAGRITVVILWYYGYARQDRKVLLRAPITAKLVADLITAAGANRVMTMGFACRSNSRFF